MRIAVLGATGQTGQYLVKQAIQKGYGVTAVVRNPGKLLVCHENLKVVKGDVFSKDSLKRHLEGHDAVISCLGFPISPLFGVTGYTKSMRAVVCAAQEVGVNRVITMTSWYTDPNSLTGTASVFRLFLLTTIQSVLSNMYEMEHYLKQVNNIDWTVVRPPGLRNEPATAKEFLTREGYFVPDSSGLPIGRHAVARGDVSRFMLSVLDSNSWIKRGVAITTK
ncbi:flavin reductase (NADPH)-like [Clupea harengus]|uniref:Flavin reductase (NADPH)-like n=1 Tax=Clupea harengus TaxID=7950 RepID=A0A6P3VV29_CLUHA|nr:flavin reductase (NADPH)-like [Clupea harengus]